jgi:ABC-2 type transport system permease protein
MKTILVALFGEFREGLLISWTYKVNQLISLLTLGFIFFIVVFFMGGGKLDPDRIASSLVGYLVWMYVAAALGDLTYGLRGEISAGTLEQLAMSPIPIGILLIGRVIANLLITSVQVILMGFIVLSLIHVRIFIPLSAVLALLITFIGVLGFGYIIAGMMLLFKQVEALNNLFNNALAFFNGAFLPVSAMPAWMASISVLLPSTLGIIVIRSITLEGKTLLETWNNGNLVALIINSVLYLLIGLGIYTLCERVAKNRGSLGQYLPSPTFALPARSSLHCAWPR